MDWTDLRYALMVARTGSVTEAARELGVAHTTVYRRVNGLEERQGLRFFDRTGATWALTDAGRELLDVGLDLEHRVQAFERRLRGKDQRLEGNVSLATVEALAVMLSRSLGTFRERHPAITVDLHVTNDLVNVGPDADIALRITPSPPESLKGRRVATIGFATFAASSLLHAGPVDLEASNWICYGHGRTPQAVWERHNVRDQQIVLRTNSRAVFLEAVSQGIGVGVLPCGLATNLPHLIPVSEVISDLDLPLWLLTHEDLAPMPRVRALLEFVADTLSDARERLAGRQGALGTLGRRI